VYSFFMKEFFGRNAPVTIEGEVDEPANDELVCYRTGLPIDERLTRIDEELIPVSRVRQVKPAELTKQLRGEVFRYFPEKPAPLEPEWSPPTTSQGRTVRKVTFTSFEGLRVRATYSLPASSTPAVKQPAVLIVDHRKGIPVWGNEQPWERNQWGDRAVLIVETLDRGSRALEQNLRSFNDDDLLHHMKRQAMVAGTSLESMQLYEVLRSLELLRSLPQVDPARITIVGKGEDGINGLYAALLDGNAQRVVLQSPPASHVYGPHYLGILRYTDIPETARLLGARLRVSGQVPDALRFASVCRSLADCLR
jgi:Acetyl xylan esterase (AXE1)